MRSLPVLAIALGLSVLSVFGGESGLIRTFQPLDGSGAGGISIESVTCYVANFHSHQITSVEYIATKNVPPTRSAESSGDLNLASRARIYFGCQDAEGEEPELFMDAEKFVDVSYTREEVLRASLECLRRVLPAKLHKTELTFTASPENREWIGKIVSEFNLSDKGKEFYKAGEP